MSTHPSLTCLALLGVDPAGWPWAWVVLSAAGDLPFLPHLPPDPSPARHPWSGDCPPWLLWGWTFGAEGAEVHVAGGWVG